MQVLRLLLIVIMMCGAGVLRAQPDSSLSGKVHTVYLEAGGLAAYYSLNYQRNFRLTRKSAIAAGVIISPMWMPREKLGASFSPRAGVQAQYVYRKGRSEFGAGAAVQWYTYYYPEVSPGESHFQKLAAAQFLQLGYSYINRRNIYLGAYFTPIIREGGYRDFMAWGGLRVGYRF